MLKSLELFGFKSFADRTLFEFSPGITCVVGPNGSGKSNVVDAIKWILGDQSAKSLRGKEMSDVIFNGSSGRRASGFAEATLTFDNSQGLLPIDTSQVAIGRRLYQSGDSEYLLNGSAVRLKDIRDVFIGTGAGTAAYSIIEQGRVDQILQTNPTTRRMVFEEAAGVSKFKARRVEAERRLERVAQNLLRLTDIVDEVETQLNSTRSQASKAARFREVSTELKKLWTGLAADDYRDLADKIERGRDKLTQLKSEQATLQQEIQQIELNKQELDRAVSNYDDRLIDHERAIANDRQAIATHRATIHHQESRLSELEVEIKNLRRQRAQANYRLCEVEVEYRKTEEKVHAFAVEHETARRSAETRSAAVKELQQSAQRWQNEIDTHQQEIDLAEKKKRDNTEQIAVEQAQAKTLHARQEDFQLILQKAEEHVQIAEADALEIQKELSAAQAESDRAEEQVQALLEKRSDLSDQKSAATQQLAELKEKRSADSARLTVLEELEGRQEGIAIGVQEILKRAQTSHFPPWNRILGLVRDLIEVPIELAPIIDAALGERAQLLATSDLKSILDYLNRGPAPIDGRVGFIRITPVDETPQLIQVSNLSSTLELTGLPGVFGRADRLIKESKRATGVATAVLGDTWIVDSLSDARNLIDRHPEAVELRFVTLQGEVLSPSGELFVGNIPHESSIISRKSELRQLRNGIRQSERMIESLTERQTILEQNIGSKHHELATARQASQETSAKLSECTALLSSQRKEIERLKTDYREKEQQVAELQNRIQQVQAGIVQLKNRQVEIDQACDESQTLLSELKELLQGAEDSIRDHQDEMKAEQLEIAKHEERLTNLRETQSRIAKEHRLAKREVEELQARFTQAAKLQKRGELEMLAAEAGIALHSLSLEKTTRETKEDFIQRDQLREQRKQLAKQEEEKYRSQRKLEDQQREVELNIQKIQHQLKGTAERIQEEFQVSIEKLVEDGASAYRDYLIERYGVEVADQHLNFDVNANHEDISIGSEEVTSAISEVSVSEETEQQVVVPSYAELRDELEARVDRLRRKLKAMGHVNTEALENLEELETRYNSLNSQLLDLQEAKAALEDIIRKINGESERIFMETFETIRGHFQELFRKLFGGGDADIILEDPEDVLECGIDIVARPPGKELRSISLLSGGEKTMTAVGMLFAMFKSKPSPYCVLDEVDAALDEANVDRYVSVVKEFVSMTQFVVITHRKRTMTAANILYGVTMEQAGVSKRISVSFEDVNDNGEIRTAA